MPKFTIPSTLLYPSPSPSMTSRSLADSEYLTANGGPSATSSRTSSPVRPAAAIVPPPPPPMSLTSPRLDRTKWMPPKEPIEFAKKPARPDYLSKKKHVPRPPNAFMLFRSMVINKEIPKIENRQQNVSRIAGEIWNVLDDDIKKAWHDKAEEYQREHREKYPDYKFAPSRKAQPKPKEEEHHGMSTEEYIRHLREKYTGVMGPAVAPTRKRKPRTRKVKDEDEEFRPTPKRTRTRTRRSVVQDTQPTPPPVRSLRPGPPFPSVPSHSLPPWHVHSTSSRMPGSSTLDLMMAGEYSGMPTMSFGSPIASGSHDSRRKARYADDNVTNDMPFGHIPMALPFDSSPGSFGTYTHDALRLGELAVPHASTSYYQSFYSGATPHLADTPAEPHASTSSETIETFTGYDFNFTDDLLANIADTSVPLPSTHIENPGTPVRSPKEVFHSALSTPAAAATELFTSLHTPPPSSQKNDKAPTRTPVHTP